VCHPHGGCEQQRDRKGQGILNSQPDYPNSHCPAGSKKAGQSQLNVLVLGLGNILLSDEGAGVRAVEELQRRYDCSNRAEFIDGGTMGLDLLPYFEGRSHILILDAVKTGDVPGTIVRIDDPPAYFRSITSPHQIGLADVLCLAAMTGDLPRNITLFGIEPRQLSTGLDLSREVAVNLGRLVDMVVAGLKQIGVDVQPKKL
jgi:hydrogenase maturation protease